MYIDKFHTDMDNNINRITNIHKFNVENILKNIKNIQDQKIHFYFKIHKYAQQVYMKDKNQTIDQLREKVISYFDLKDFNIDIYLIDKSYTIFDATYKKDIGFNLGMIEDAKLYLDNAKMDNKIHVASNISIDILDTNINVYSYSKIDDDLFFEMGFKSKLNLSKQIRSDLNRSIKDTHIKIDIFKINEDSNGLEYYSNILDVKSNTKIKQNYYNNLKRFDKSKSTDDLVINSFRLNSIIKQQSGKSIEVYAPIFKTDKSKIDFYDNIILKLTIDISEHIDDLNKTKIIFTVSIFILFLLLIVLYVVLKKQFYSPIISISKVFEDNVKITDKILLDKKDEFAILIKKYNQLYDSFQNEIEKNQLLLDENKQFIADMVHQIRTPLSVIMANASFIELKGGNNVLKYTDQINSSINMLTNSYEDLSYIISHDTLEYNPVKLDISEFVQNRVYFFHTIAKVNLKTLKSTIQQDIYFTINDTEFERLIDNNISNAIKYGEHNSIIEINLKKENQKIVLEFISSGKKINNPNRLFEKNYTESNSAKRSLGLGLFMVKNICTKYNITYKVHSSNNKNMFRYSF